MPSTALVAKSGRSDTSRPLRRYVSNDAPKGCPAQAAVSASLPHASQPGRKRAAPVQFDLAQCSELALDHLKGGPAMFKSPTVFVIGAGASAECGLPVGNALKEAIATALRFRFEVHRLTSGDEELLRILKKRFENDHEKVNEHTRAANELVQTMPMHISIDEALHYWSDKPQIVQLGKLAIAHEILKAERASSITQHNDRSRVAVDNASRTWLWEFFRMAMAAITKAEVESAFENVTIINFNYDRTVEHYLYWALQDKAAVSSEAAARSLSHLQVIRPYGSVGKLEWMDSAGVPYGCLTNSIDLFAVAGKIRTYTEQHQTTDVEQQIDRVLETAALVVFLGFGFHSQNMIILSPKAHAARPSSWLLGTVFGIHSENHEALKNELVRLRLGGRVRLLDCRSQELLSNLQPTIMMTVGR
jgi:hypothetical protein